MTETIGVEVVGATAGDVPHVFGRGEVSVDPLADDEVSVDIPTNASVVVSLRIPEYSAGRAATSARGAGPYVVHIAPSFKLIDTAQIALKNLLDARDFLSLQLSCATGGMSEDELNEIAPAYLQTKKWPAQELERRTSALVALLREHVDADVVATALRCDLDDAEAALMQVARRLAAGARAPALLQHANDE